MQTHGGTVAAAFIEGNERQFDISVKVDWNGDGRFSHTLSNLSPFIDNVSVDRSLKGSAPEEILLIEGASAAELTLTMGGEFDGLPLTAVFSPYNSRSPFYNQVVVGAEITYSLILVTPLGEFVYPQFVGNVRTVSPDRAANTVELTALDRVEMLGTPVQLPPWAMSDEHVNYGEINSQLVRSHWVIDSCLRLCDVSPSGKRPVDYWELPVENENDGIQVWVTGNGSYLPTVGWLDNPNADTFPNAGTEMYRQNAPIHPKAPAGVFPTLSFNGLGLPVQQRYGTPNDRGIIRYWSADRDSINPQTAHYLGFTINGPEHATIGDHSVLEVYIGQGRKLDVYVGAGQVWSTRTNFTNGTETVSSAKRPLPAGQAHTDVFVCWDNSSTSGSRCRIWVNETDYGWQTIGSPVTSGGQLWADQIKGRVTIGQALSLSDLYYGARNVTSPRGIPGDAWRYSEYVAVLDNGLNRFSHMPDSKAVTAWDYITAVANAEFGSVFWDENGVFRFLNYGSIDALQKQIVRTINLDHVPQLKITNSLDSVRNVYVVQANKKRASFTSGPLYESNDVMEFYVPPNSSKDFMLWVDDVVSPLTFQMSKFSSAADANTPRQWQDNTPHGYCVQWLINGVWAEHNEFVSGVDVQVYFTREGYLRVHVYNGYGYPARLAKGLTSATEDNSSPALHIQGTKIYEDATVSHVFRNEDSINKYDEMPLELSGDWFQDGFATTSMLTMMMDRTAEPIPTTDGIEIAGDPRLQLADTIAVLDPEGFGDAIPLQILGIKRTWDIDQGLTDNLTVEMVVPSVVEPTPAPPPVEDGTDDEPDDMVTITRTNLAKNPYLKTDAAGWYGGARVTGITAFGDRTSGYKNTPGHAIASPRAKVVVGKTYTFAVSEIADYTGNLEFGVDWYSSTGWMAGESSTFTIGDAGVHGRVWRTATAPANAVEAVVTVRPPDQNTITVTRLYVEETDKLGSYFDGDTVGGKYNADGTSSITEKIVNPAPGGGSGGGGTTPAPSGDTAAARLNWGNPISAFSDEFNYVGAPDPARWGVYNGPGHAGNGRRVAQNAQVNGSYLRMTGMKNGDAAGMASRYNQKYGRWEVRARFSPKAGDTGNPYHAVLITWPQSEQWPQGGEYDFLEVVQGETRATAWMHHPADTVVQKSFHSGDIDLSQWHNYGFEWNSTALIGYLDGVEWFRYTEPSAIVHEPMHLTMQIDNFFPENNLREAYFDIDWARAYTL